MPGQHPQSQESQSSHSRHGSRSGSKEPLASTSRAPSSSSSSSGSSKNSKGKGAEKEQSKNVFLCNISIDGIFDIKNGGPYFSPERLQELDKMLDEVEKTGCDVVLTDVKGALHKYPVRRINEKSEKSLKSGNSQPLHIRWRSWQKMGLTDQYMDQTKPGYNEHRFLVGQIERYTLPTCNCVENENLGEEVNLAREQWKNLNFKKQLKDYIKGHQEDFADITQISCFALGSFGCVRPRRIAMQHLAAISISKWVSKARKALRPNQCPGVTIFAQDPDYCAHCESVLSGMARTAKVEPIRIVKDPKGWLGINSTTMCIFFCANVPALQIICDYLSSCDGPAAMLCDRIEDDGLRFNNVSYERGDFEDPNVPHANPSCPSAWAYRKKCNILKLDEHAEHFGNNWEKERNKGKAKWDKKNREALNNKVIFGDTELYVRKHDF